ncbi:MAG: alpha/beta hydrolase [Pseudomonadota bacterium]|nr:alpha/beta hydrolase [Pseudomonadota bacterium]
MSSNRFEAQTGGYVWIEAEGVKYRIYYETAGSGQPLICVHTSGADSRQWRHVLNDPKVTDNFRVIAFDLPWHGKSNPPEKWWLTRYALTKDTLVGVIRGVWEAFDCEQPIVAGCSIGGYVCLQLAYECQDDIRGVIGIEAIAKSPGRYNDFLHHPAIHGSEFVACWTYGLNSPYSDEEARRENWWYYAQGGPGVYAGNTAFGREFDMRPHLKDIDTSKCKVSILSGEYDYSATPEMSKAAADGIKGSRFILMKKMGHFPIIEDYPGFQQYFLTELAEMMK